MPIVLEIVPDAPIIVFWFSPIVIALLGGALFLIIILSLIVTISWGDDPESKAEKPLSNDDPYLK